MHDNESDRWRHDHVFGQDQRRTGERRTLIVIALTFSMMVVEVIAGIVYGSMALLADGLHMASHALALAISAFAYVYARKHASDAGYSFGTGKVNALGGFSGAILLAMFAFFMAWESALRLIQPVEIVFNQAIAVAVTGLLVNTVCVYILGHAGEVDDDPDHQQHHPHHHDYNLKSAYLHVLADTLTSVLAIIALLTAKYLGLIWIDPLIGIVGAVLIARWATGLLRNTSEILLDRQGPESLARKIREGIESDGDSRVTDLHLWSIGHGIYAAVVTVIAHQPATPTEYKARLPSHLGLAHISIEVHICGTD